MATDQVNILVVDDLTEKLLVIESILADLGANIVQAHSGEEALRHVLDMDFAAILLDVNMPGMDGLETAAYIRRRKKSAHVPIIFITAYADELHSAQGYSLGAVDYIMAPIMPEVLRSKVKVFVDLYRMHQQAQRQAEERARAEARQAATEEIARRSAFLAEAGRVLASSLDPETTARALARLVVPFLADLSAVTTVDEQGQPVQVELAWSGSVGEVRTHSAPAGAGLSAPLLEAIRRVLASGKAELASEAGAWQLPADAGPSVPFLSVVHLPLCARGHCIGVLTLARGQAGGGFDPSELTLAENLADRAATALDNARLYRNIQEGDRRKSEFLAMLAHELRNPLAPIRNAVQVMRLAGGGEPALVRARDIIDRQVTHMARLIDELLDMSRLSRGKILLRTEPLDLVSLVRSTVEDHRSILEEAGLKLQLSLPNRPLGVIGDPTRLAQVVGNILQNAQKFTDAGGQVTVTLKALPPEKETTGKGWAQLTIRDTGIGMEKEMIARLFEPFAQADCSLDRSRGGLGLGLALVKGLVELHGGQVSAVSEGLGKGTEITIRLPLAPTPAPRTRPRTSNGQTVGPYRILLIEDNLDTAESMRQLLMMSGHEVEVSVSGSAGVQLARLQRPEVVLCDIGLPGGMDGYAVARAIREEPTLATTRLIALTGYGQEEDQRRSLEAGFDLHLTKPVDFAELQRALAQLSSEQ
jgi:signal transduction histidine kinase/DNA-binding response OmpR family regulator